jgi:hypothetical protein
MQLLKDLLDATIKYQDVIDDDNNKTIFLYYDMLIKANKARQEYPNVINQFTFERCGDRMKEFENLQMFIAYMREYESEMGSEDY